MSSLVLLYRVLTRKIGKYMNSKDSQNLNDENRSHGKQFSYSKPSLQFTYSVKRIGCITGV